MHAFFKLTLTYLTVLAITTTHTSFTTATKSESLLPVFENLLGSGRVSSSSSSSSTSSSSPDVVSPPSVTVDVDNGFASSFISSLADSAFSSSSRPAVSSRHAPAYTDSDRSLHSSYSPMNPSFIQTKVPSKVADREYDSIYTQKKDEEKTAWVADCKPSTDGRPVVAITFDDGPFDRKTAMEIWSVNPSHLDKSTEIVGDPTPVLLDNLQSAGIKATFFIVGEHGVKHPEMLTRMYVEGHSIGGHSWDHRNFHLIDSESQILDIERPLDLIEAITGGRPSFSRMPFGYRPDAVKYWMRDTNVTEVYWRFDTKDWLDGYRELANLDLGFKAWRETGTPWPNPIVLFHDANPYTMTQLPQIMAKFEEQAPGVKFVDMYECLGIPRPPFKPNQPKVDAIMHAGYTYISSPSDSCEALDWTEPMSFHLELISNPYLADGCSLNILVSFFVIFCVFIVMIVFFLSRLTSSAHFIPITQFESSRNHFVFGFQLVLIFVCTVAQLLQSIRRVVGVNSYAPFPREDFITWSELLSTAFWLFPLYHAFFDQWHPSKVSPYTFVHSLAMTSLRAIRLYLNLMRTTDVIQSHWFWVDVCVLAGFWLVFCGHFFLHVWQLEELPVFEDKEEDPSPIFFFFPLCNESEEEVSMVLGLLKPENFKQKKLRKRLRFTIVIDGQWDYSVDTATVRGVFNILGINPNEPPTSIQYGARVWNIVVNEIPVTILIKGDRLVPGKRYSQLLFAHHLAQEIQHMSAHHQQNAMILTLDGDVSTDGYSVSLLVDVLTKNKTAAGVSGYVKVANYGSENWWDPIISYQNFDYRMCTSEKIMESWLGACTCLPGCFSLLRYAAFKACLPHYAIRPSKNDLLAINELNLGEDRSLTTMLLRKDVNVLYECEAVASTVVPDSLAAFLGQRRRWFNSTVVNDLSLLFIQSPLLRFNNPIRVFGWFMCLVRIVTIVLSVTVATVAIAFCFEALLKVDQVVACTWTVIYQAFFCLVVMNRDTNFLKIFLELNAAAASILLTIAAAQGIYAASHVTALLVVAVFYGAYFVLLVLYLIVDRARNGTLKPLLWLYGLFSAVFLCAFTALIIPLYALSNLDDETWGTRGAGSVSKQVYNHGIQLPSYKTSHVTPPSVDKVDKTGWLPFFYEAPAARYDPEAEPEGSVKADPPLLSAFSMKLLILFAFFLGHSTLCYVIFLPGLPRRWILAGFFLIIIGNFVFRYALVVTWRAIKNCTSTRPSREEAEANSETDQTHGSDDNDNDNESGKGPDVVVDSDRSSSSSSSSSGAYSKLETQ